jgi:hypothetical protein
MHSLDFDVSYTHISSGLPCNEVTGYYIPIPTFKPWPMKKLSNPMGVMWESDPNKSLWSLMAKAWSMIRDQIGKDKAPLDQFFQIICPYLNIPSPETYLERHGWELIIDEDGSPSLSRNYAPSSDLCGAGIVNMALSVEDIIMYCQSMGYAQEYTPRSITVSPTFLAHPYGHPVINNSTVGLQTQTASLVHNHRVAARNKRRTKRQNAKNTGTVPMLQEQIINAHVTETINPPQDDSSAIFIDSSVPFYGDLSDLLTTHAMVDYQPHDSSSPCDSIDMNQTAMSDWTDWGAFRTGADENVTLPFFDPTFM